MEAAQLPQSENADSVPYITVQADARGGACWAVVGLGTVVRCYTGHHAITVLAAMATATGLVTPS
jgi:6,7-dimethyl-8-ribityllumazine synthase